MNKVHGGNIYEIARKYGLRADQIIDFSASVNPLGLSPKAKKKLLEGLPAVLHYPDARCSELTAALDQFHGLGEGQILAGAGSTEFIYALPRTLDMRRVLLVTPAFSEYENAFEVAGTGASTPIDYFGTKEEDGFELNMEGLLSALTRGYDALYLGNPNNPTGILAEKEDLLKILEATEKAKIWFILDETFIDLVEEESFKKEAVISSRLIILRSLTNFFALPGLRVGYMIANPEAIQTFRQCKEPWTVNALAQIAAVASLKDKSYIAHTKTFIHQERRHLIKGLQSIPGLIPYPSVANFLFVQLHPALDLTATELRGELIPRSILIRDCRSFHHLGPYFFRVAIRSRRENNLLLKALRQIVT